MPPQLFFRSSVVWTSPKPLIAPAFLQSRAVVAFAGNGKLHLFFTPASFAVFRWSTGTTFFARVFKRTRKVGALGGALPPLVKCINKLYLVRFKVDNSTRHKIDWFGMSKLF
jgi:hypothetical protein